MTQTEERAESSRIQASYRDPSGFVFKKDGIVYRQINKCYQQTYENFMSSGLYKILTDKKLLVSHQELGIHGSGDAYKIISPQKIPFISYPYEWSFSQLKDAALITLEIQKEALKKGFTLKDATAYNVQFSGSKAIFIDSLSFEEYKEGTPWIAYRQFCEHFLMPLSLAYYSDLHILALQRSYINGIPLETGTALLPLRARANFGLLTHLFIHSKFQKKYADEKVSEHSKTKISRFQQEALIDSLYSCVKKLTIPKKLTTWGDYYDGTNYTEAGMQWKKDCVESMIKNSKAETVLDLGANTGVFSELAAKHAEFVLSVDLDPLCVERNYIRLKKDNSEKILPLVIDLMNPSPSIGWDLEERPAFTERYKGDLSLALALIHHLAIGQNLPLDYVAKFMAKISPHLIIEFVPKEDSQVKRLLANREDIFPNYNKSGFEESFGAYFTILESKAVPESSRTMYLLRAK